MSTGETGAVRAEPVPTGAEPRQAELDVTFEVFCQENFIAVQRFLHSQCADRELVQEAIQEAFLTAGAKWEQVRRYEKPLGWMYKTARYKLMAQLDRRRRTAAANIDDVPPDRLVEPSDPQEAQDLLDSWLQRLPPRQAATFRMSLDGWADEEIAQLLSLTRNTVRAYKTSARQRLQQLAQEAGFTAPVARR